VSESAAEEITLDYKKNRSPTATSGSQLIFAAASLS